MLKEFKDFIAKGNVMDMAVGIIMGAAFTTIVKSLVDDVLMTIIGMFTGGAIGGQSGGTSANNGYIYIALHNFTCSHNRKERPA